MAIAIFQRTFLGGCFLVAAGLASPAAAQTYLEEYKAYNAALEASDLEAAIAHACAAWRAAEEELGDHRLTAILAYNYSQLVLFSNTESALLALRRAETLRQSGVVELPGDDLTLSIAYAEFAGSDGARREADALRELLAQSEANGVPPNKNVARMWLALATSDVENERYRIAQTSARSAEAAITAAYPDDYRTQATTIILQGVARLMTWPRRKSDIKEAINLFGRAIDLFPPRSPPEELDTMLAEAMAWKHAAHSAYASREYREELSEDSNEYKIANPQWKTLEECGTAWEKREQPGYPEKALEREYIGAVVFEYRIDDDTNVHDVRVLAEVPRDAFGDIVVDSVKKWRLKTPSHNDPQCRGTIVSIMSFYIIDPPPFR